jgi:diadenosine tetraphosphate (Ap4A) HIT family hydrolase
VMSPKRKYVLSTTLRRLEFVELHMHLIPRDSLGETGMSEFNECSDSWVQTVLEATEKYDLSSVGVQIQATRRTHNAITGLRQRGSWAQ